jgi:mRNA-degrading endonuclease toxin of MazEF toxin-antitoxin module
MHLRRGEVWWIAFDPSVGGEIQKTRPALIVSNNAANAALNRLIVVPLTSPKSACARSSVNCLSPMLRLWRARFFFI